MPQHDGPDRRESCDNHERNTTDIAGIKSSLSTGRWILGLIIGVAVIVIGSSVGDIKDALKEIQSDVKEVKTLQYRVDRLEQDVRAFHAMRRSDHGE